MAYAYNVFRNLQAPNVFTWNTMIRGYAESDDARPAVDVFRRMRWVGVESDTHTYPFVLKAIGRLMDGREAERVHGGVEAAESLRLIGFPDMISPDMDQDNDR
ncbi:hypothetical protein ACET3Z_001422 [Daucus carota]